MLGGDVLLRSQRTAPERAFTEADDPAADGRMYAFDYDFCQGCGICVAECPSRAIEMFAETI